MRALSLFITVPLTLFALSFAVSNPSPVDVALWPFDGILLHQPLAIVVLALMGAAFFLGALFASFLSWSVRLRYWQEKRRTRRLERQIRAIEDERAAAAQKPTTRPVDHAVSLPPVV